MTVHTVLRMGDPRLLERAAPVETFGTPELHTLVGDLFETMRAHNGVGLAAPQIGVGLQVVVFGFHGSARYPDAAPIPDTVLINPVLTPLGSDEEEDWEGCLSVPGLRGRVPRFHSLSYRAFDAFGLPVERVVHGFHARVVQHECDHLFGVLYPQRIRDLKQFGFTEELFPERVSGLE